MGEPGKIRTLSPLQAIREKCMDCHGRLNKGVKFCPSDGVNSTRCELWPYRFGKRPATAALRHGAKFLTPGDLPGASECLDDL